MSHNPILWDRRDVVGYSIFALLIANRPEAARGTRDVVEV